MGWKERICLVGPLCFAPLPIAIYNSTTSRYLPVSMVMVMWLGVLILGRNQSGCITPTIWGRNVIAI